MRRRVDVSSVVCGCLLWLTAACMGCSDVARVQQGKVGLDVLPAQTDVSAGQQDSLDAKLEPVCVLPPGCVDPNGDGDLTDGIGDLAHSFLADNSVLSFSEYDGPLSCERLKEVSFLRGRKYTWWEEGGVTSLDGIQCMPNVWTMWDVVIGDHTDIKPVPPILESLAGLEALTQLTELVLERYHIKSLDPIKDLVKLEWLSLHNWFGPTVLLSLDPVTKLTNLRWLRLENYTVPSLAPMADLIGLEQFVLSGHGDAPSLSLEPLGKLTKLVTLAISDQPVESLAPVSKLVNLGHLELSVWGDPDGPPALDPLSSLQLNVLMLTVLGDVNGPLSLGPLSGMKILTWIEIHRSKIETLAPVSGLVYLKRFVSSGGGPIDGDLGPLFTCKVLTHLDIDVPGVVDLSGIEDLDELEYLALINADIVDLQPLIDKFWPCEDEWDRSLSIERPCFLKVGSAPAVQLAEFKAAHPCVAVEITK